MAPQSGEFLSGEFRGWRSLAGYSTGGHEESDTTEQLIHLTIYYNLYDRQSFSENNLIEVCFKDNSRDLKSNEYFK